MIKSLLTRLLLLSLCAPAVNAQDTLRFMTYNILNFSGSDTDRLDELRTIIRAIDPDIIVHQEIEDQAAVNNILNQVLHQLDPDWSAAAFVNGPDTDNACFYMSSRVSLVSQRQIPTQLRDFTEYVVTSAALSDGEVFRLYSGHLKASQGVEEEQRRLAECQVLRGELEELDPGSLFMFAGDFNLYTSFEPAYQFLLGLEPSPNSRFLDPINRPGNWNNSISFADIHTQSPRTQSFGGGATGGLDDRFDFILASAAWMDTVGSYCLPATYTSFGNDGDHFNQAVNDGTNQAVPDSVADALHNMADHLPVFMDIVLRPSATPVSPLPPVVESAQLATCYPNPFNPILNVSLATSPLAGELRVFDIMGRSLRSVSLTPSSANATLSLDFAPYSSGPYFIVVQRGTQSEVSRVILQK